METRAESINKSEPREERFMIHRRQEITKRGGLITINNGHVVIIVFNSYDSPVRFDNNSWIKSKVFIYLSLIRCQNIFNLKLFFPLIN